MKPAPDRSGDCSPRVCLLYTSGCGGADAAGRTGRDADNRRLPARMSVTQTDGAASLATVIPGCRELLCSFLSPQNEFLVPRYGVHGNLYVPLNDDTAASFLRAVTPVSGNRASVSEVANRVSSDRSLHQTLGADLDRRSVSRPL